MTEWRVLVVEDDRMVARLHCRFVAGMSGFTVVGIATTAAQAEQMIATLKPDLVLLDLGLPDESGIALLRRLRAGGSTTEAIVVTASTSAQVVRATVHLGVVDYLVKPFDQERLRQSLALFRRRMAMLSPTSLAQDEVDQICSDGPNARRWLPRDLAEGRLLEIQHALRSFAAPATAVDVAATVGVSRVTARRYLEYLVTTGRARVSVTPDGPGRPSKTYVADALVGAGA
jgi:response regulator of citrate/malate metabolism